MSLPPVIPKQQQQQKIVQERKRRWRLKKMALCNLESASHVNTRFMAPTVLSQQAPWCFTKLLPVRSKTKTLLLQRPPSSSLFFLQFQKYHPTLMKLQQPPSSTVLSLSAFSLLFLILQRKDKKKKIPEASKLSDLSDLSVHSHTVYPASASA